MRTVVTVLVLFFLVGCGARDVTDNDLKASRQLDVARGNCYNAVASQAASDVAMIKSVKEADRTMVTLVYLNNKQTSALISAVTGHRLDRCAGTNLWDFMIAEADAKNKALGKGLGHAVTGLKWVAGAWAVTDIMSGYGTSSNVEGQFNSLSNTSNQKSGNTATSNKESGNTTTVSDSPAGDGNLDWRQANPVNN